MEIGVKVVAENLRTNSKRHTTSCYFTMVAMDENGKPTEVPRLQLENDVEKQHYAEAELRKQLRQENLQKTRLLAAELTEDKF